MPFSASLSCHACCPVARVRCRACFSDQNWCHSTSTCGQIGGPAAERFLSPPEVHTLAFCHTRLCLWGNTVSHCCSVELRWSWYRRISPTSYPDAFAMIDEHVRPRWPMAGEPLYRWSGQASLAALLLLSRRRAVHWSLTALHGMRRCEVVQDELEELLRSMMVLEYARWHGVVAVVAPGVAIPRI